MTVDRFATGAVARAETDLTAAELRELRPHVVNLSKGAFSESGNFATGPADVDAIFAEHLPAFVAAAGGRPVPLVFWAHGGMVNEQSGLRIAHDQSRWWRDNGAYPLHFVWESGLWEILGQLLLGRRLARGFDITELSDALIEEAIDLPGGLIWLGMKNSAALASADGGGAAYVAIRGRSNSTQSVTARARSSTRTSSPPRWTPARPSSKPSSSWHLPSVSTPSPPH
jgi:hypothetical protein